MEDEELYEETAHAEELLDEESAHSARPSSGGQSQHATQRMTLEDLGSLRRRHAFLADFSDLFIMNTPIGDLMKIETTAIKVKEVERAKDSADRLASNKMALASTFVTLPEARDNRWNVLHPARFLAGSGCSGTKLWLAAREVIGLNNFPPIGCYDMGAVGLAGHVSARGWLELHCFSGSKLSVKLFNINSGPKQTGRPTEDPEDILEVAEFKLALRTMRTAVSLVRPWDLSVLALEGFFFQNNFCMADLDKFDKKAWHLTRFTDYVLEQNADRWRDAEPFLTTGELKTTWTA